MCRLAIRACTRQDMCVLGTKRISVFSRAHLGLAALAFLLGSLRMSLRFLFKWLSVQLFPAIFGTEHTRSRVHQGSPLRVDKGNRQRHANRNISTVDIFKSAPIFFIRPCSNMISSVPSFLLLYRPPEHSHRPLSKIPIARNHDQQQH